MLWRGCTVGVVHHFTRARTHVFMVRFLLGQRTIGFFFIIVTINNMPDLTSIHSTLYTVQCTIYTVHCTLYSVYFTLYIVQYTIQYNVYIVHCTLYTAKLYNCVQIKK